MSEYLVRFLIGGVVVSAFAMLGDMLRPKSFAGLFGAAPSVALGTLGIAIHQHV